MDHSVSPSHISPVRLPKTHSACSTPYESRTARGCVETLFTLNFNTQLDGKQVYFNFRDDTLVFRNTIALKLFCSYEWGRPVLEENKKKHAAQILIVETQLRKIAICGLIDHESVHFSSRFHNLREVIGLSRPGVQRRNFSPTDRLFRMELKFRAMAEMRGQKDFQMPIVELIDYATFVKRFPVGNIWNFGRGEMWFGWP